MSLRASFWAACFVAGHTASKPGPNIVALDHIVAVVDKEVLTESQLLAEARLNLAWREGQVAASAELPPTLVQALRAWSIDQMLIASQAHRLGSDDVSDVEVLARVSTLIQRFESQAAYEAFCVHFGITEQVVYEAMSRDLRCEHYMQQRMRTRLLGNAQSRAIEPERYAAAVRLWLDELRQSAEIRLQGPGGALELERSR